LKSAVIDIGSNSVRLMLWADGTTLYKKLQTTRLGEGLIATGRLTDAAIVRSTKAVCGFLAEAEAAGAEQIFAFATAAVRSAENGGDFVSAVKEACGINVDVVSGEEEALLGLYGALGNEDGSILDIGGASTELCSREGGKIAYSTSLPVGAVRLFDACGEDKTRLERAIDRAIEPLKEAKISGKTVAIGGTATSVAAIVLKLEEYDPSKVQDLILTFEEAERISERLLSLSLEERRALRGLDEKRAEIIGGGALLLVKIMEKLGLNRICISDRDNQEGYLYRRFHR